MLITKYVDQIKKNELDGACDMYGGDKMCIHGFVVLALRERDHWEDLGIDGRMI